MMSIRRSKINLWLYPELAAIPDDQLSRREWTAIRRRAWRESLDRRWLMAVPYSIVMMTGFLLLGGHNLSVAWRAIAVGLMCSLGSVLGLLVERETVRRLLRRRLHDMGKSLCPKCGYDIATLANGRCPECGHVVEYNP